MISTWAFEPIAFRLFWIQLYSIEIQIILI